MREPLFMFALMALSSQPAACLENSSCEASDQVLLHWRKMLCNSLVQGWTPYCQDDWQNVTASKDWPNQAVYMQNILTTLASPSTCLNTSYAGETTTWLDGQMANLTTTGNFMWTWQVFQVQYYDTPRKPGTRIEAPDTLGRKCWAMAFLAQEWPAVHKPLTARLARSGLNITVLAAAYEEAIPLTMQLCQKVICNCFLNTTYDPSHSGRCKLDVDKFHFAGFDREAIHPGRPSVKYGWHEHC
jgi:hypothetical protein